MRKCLSEQELGRDQKKQDFLRVTKAQNVIETRDRRRSEEKQNIEE